MLRLRTTWPLAVALSACVYTGSVEAQETPSDNSAASAGPTELPEVIVETQELDSPASSNGSSQASISPSPQQTPAAIETPGTETATPPPTGTIGQPPAPFAGGQVGTGTQAGFLGNKSVFDTPFSTTSFTAKTIEDQQARSIADVLANAPSVRAVTSGDGVYDFFFIRGFPVTTSAFSLNGLPGITPGQMVAPEFVERVELWNGPSGMVANAPLFGAVGGTINIITKKAYDEPLTSVTTSYYSDGQASSHLDFGRRFGTSKEFGVRINGVYRDGDTAVDEQQERLGLATVALDYHGEFVRMSLDAGYQEQRWDAQLMSMVYNGPAGQVPAPPASGRNPFQSWSSNDVRDAFVAWQGEVDLAPGVTAYAAAGYRDDKSVLLSSYQEIEDQAGNTTVYPYFEPYTSRVLSANSGVNADFSTGSVQHALRAGAQIQWARIGYSDVFFSDFASNIYDPFRTAGPSTAGLSTSPPLQTENTLTSVGIADTLSFFGDTLQIIAGVRHQTIEVDRFDGTPAETLDSSYDESKVTPSVGVIVKPIRGLSIYASYIEGLSEGPRPPSTVVNRDAVFPPSVTEQYEAGAKFDFGRLAVTLSAFEISRPSGFVDAATNTFVVDGEQRNRGIELATFGEFSRNIRVLGGISFIDAVLVSTENGANDGNTAPGVPDVQLNMGAEYDVAMVPGLTLTGRVIYTSEQKVDAANSISIPDWTRVDLGVRYETIIVDTPTTFRVMVENVADESYWSSAAGGALSLGTPRRYLLSTTAKF